MDAVEQKIKDFIVENFLFGDDSGLGSETSFLENGIIDSTGVLELVAFIDEEFNVTVADEELIPENLDSIENIMAFLQRKIPGQNTSGRTSAVN